MSEIPDILKGGERARLIPVGAVGSKEQRIASTVLAVLSSVDEFGKGMLGAIGAPAGQRAKIECYTEVVFKRQAEYRPDGLVVVKTRNSVWTAIVEAKIGNADLDEKQIVAYLDIARQVGADAVITLSNQYATLSTHHPVSVRKSKLQKVDLFHWSWTFLLTEARLYENNNQISDPDQAYILSEMVRFLEHESSGVTRYDRMPAGWRDLCTSVKQQTKVTRTSPVVDEVVSAWHELTRFLALKLSEKLKRNVSVHLSRRHQREPQSRVLDDIALLVSDTRLSVEFEIPDAASRIRFDCDLARKTLTSSMVLVAPKDRKTSKAVCTWIYKQIEDCQDDELLVVAKWAGTRPDTSSSLCELHEDRKSVLGKNLKLMPVAFEVRRVMDLGGRFKGAKTFVEDAQTALPQFYDMVGQHLRAWVPSPPPFKSEIVDSENAVVTEPH